MSTDNAPAHADSQPSPHHHVRYGLVFLALVVLTGLTLAATWYTPDSEWEKVLIALSIATVKATLVAMFFMHLKFEGKLIFIILFVPLALCVLLTVALVPDILHGPLFNSPPTGAHEIPVQGSAPMIDEPSSH